MSQKKITAIPVPPKTADPAMRAFLNSIKEAVEVRLGRRGDPLEEAITKRELVESGIAGLRSAYQGTLQPVTVPPDEARITPPVPIGFTAEGVFGGVHLTWENPFEAYNVHAYAEIWRGDSNDRSLAVLINMSRGSTFFDRIPDPDAGEYWYWVRFISEYNREGPFSMPVAAQKLADVTDLLKTLSGAIDESQLAEELSGRIDLVDGDGVGSVTARIKEETDARLEAIAEEAAARESGLLHESEARASAVEALTSELQVLTAKVGDDLAAAVLAEQTARSDADGALAERITALTAQVGSDLAAAILEESSARADEDGALAERIVALTAQNEDIEAAIVAEQKARADGDGALASQITALTAKVGEDIEAAVYAESQARSDALGTVAGHVTALSTKVDNNSASIDSQALSINGLSAQFTLKLDVNGYVSGYGAYNDGKVSDFAVVADRFWIAPPNSTGKIKPFIVENNTVYMNAAVIKDASIQQGKLGPISFGKIVDAAGRAVTTVAGKLRADAIDVASLQVTDANIAGVLKSSKNASNGQPRWMLDKNGGMTLNGSGSGGRMEIRDTVIKVFDGNNRLRVHIGDLSA